VSVPGGALEWVVVGVAGTVGVAIGSFLNVVIYRAPLGLSLSTPRSFCPTCDRTLSWRENVPVASWLALGGRCHTCRERISVRYPLVEIGTGAAFALVAWAWHGNALTAGYCILAATAISVALIEYGNTRSPLSVGAVGAAIGALLVVVAAIWVGHHATAVWSGVGLVGGGLAFALLRALDPACRDPRWFGRTLLPAVGCWLGGLCGSSGAAVVAGLAAGIFAEIACLSVVWAVGRKRAPTDVDVPVASVPLVTGMIAAMVVSLIVAT
jgi:leader peptidase (prepilin peptidase) / N-methyltransferase